MSAMQTSAVPRCSIDVRVRYAEVDAFGYLHHSNYFVYFEMSRTELLRQNGVRYRDLEERGVYYVVAKIECRYRAPARYDDLLTIITEAERLTRVRVDHNYRVMREEELIAEARSTLVAVGRDGRPTGLPDDVFAQMSGGMPDGVAAHGVELSRGAK